MSRPIGLLGESPGPIRRGARVLIIMTITAIIFASGVAIMATASA
ncbi:MAG: hypothetical protein AAF449_04260 [Myxococcota bacterium]